MKSSCFIPSSLLRVTAAAVNRQRASVPAPHLRCAASCYHDWGMMVCHSKNRKPSRRHPQPQILFSNHYYCYYYYNPSSCSRQQPPQQRSFTFSFAGPRLLEELLKPDAVVDKSGTEVADLWYTYHEGKANVVGLVLDGKKGPTVLERASKCPFFVQPVFRDDGHFMLVSQFQKPAHFLIAYLEDFKMDPSAATPLLTFSVFTDYAANKDVTLVRCDVLNPSLQEAEGRKVVESFLRNYHDDYAEIQTFNEKPAKFDVDDFVARMDARWKAETDDSTV